MSDIKDCMFQYATHKEIIEDTDLITLKEAKKLFDDYRQDFTEKLDCNPQMVIWINCETNGSYSETLYNWCAEDFKVIEGELYQRV